MSLRKAQNRVRKQHGIGKTALHKRMSSNRTDLSTFAYNAEYSGTWGGPFNAATVERMHELVDALGADSIIAAAYREAERAASPEEEKE